MTSRVDQIALLVRKLAQAIGVQSSKKDEPPETGLDGVTSDLDIEALSKGLLDVARDLDLYLQGLLEPSDLPIVTLKNDITKLESEIQEKDDLLDKTVEMVKKSEASFRKMKQRGLRNLYNL